KADQLEAAAATLKPDGGDVAWFAANAGNEDAPEAATTATIERFGSVDILVNNAGTNPYMGPTLGISASQMDKTHAVNQRAIVLWTAAVWEAAMQRNGGSVSNISSVGGLHADAGAVGFYNGTQAA